jgi:hypothetical protein
MVKLHSKRNPSVGKGKNNTGRFSRNGEGAF